MNIADRFQWLLEDSFYTIDACDDDESAFTAVGSRSELRLLLDQQKIRIHGKLNTPFIVRDGENVELNRSILNDTFLATVHLRHALELALYYRLAPNRADLKVRLACAILACHTTIEYVDTLKENHLDCVLGMSPNWLRQIYPKLRGITQPTDHSRNRVELISNYWRQLLPLQNIDCSEYEDADTLLEGARTLAEALLPVALPCEKLLTQGGDNRLIVDKHTRLNKYGCSPAPRPWAITFSSCTASSSSELGYQAAEEARQLLLAASFKEQRLASVFSSAMAEMHAELAGTLGFDRVSGTEILFSPSGTDVELYALFFSLVGHRQNLLNIVIEPNEIGSGSLQAAQGRHFSNILPLGGNAEIGSPIEGLQMHRVKVECLRLRDDNGNSLPVEGVDERLHTLVSRAIDRGDRVLIHLLDSAKTGIGGPSIETINGLQRRYGSSVSVLADAAQFRLDQRCLISYLEKNIMVIISGSKFFTGAPFSGALLVPPDIARSVADLFSLPSGFGDFLTRYDISPRWQRLMTSLPDRLNIGLYIRWQSALWEMKAFLAVPRCDISDYFQTFGTAILRAIDRNPNTELVASPVFVRYGSNTSANWDQLQTIFTFFIKNHNTFSITLDYDETARVYAWLNQDISCFLPDTADTHERLLAAKPCHIGQPVRIKKADGTWIGALRIAPGARLVSRARFDPTLGRDVEERIGEQIEEAEVVLEKISVIVRYWLVINAASG